jgi:hypothetical protein
MNLAVHGLSGKILDADIYRGPIYDHLIEVNQRRRVDAEPCGAPASDCRAGHGRTSIRSTAVPLADPSRRVVRYRTTVASERVCSLFK